MVLSAVRTDKRLSGSELVEVFLGELAKVVGRSPERSLDGTPQEIVDEVRAQTDRFIGCSDAAVRGLVRQVAMAVQAKGARHELRYKRMDQGRIRVMKVALA